MTNAICFAPLLAFVLLALLGAQIAEITARLCTTHVDVGRGATPPGPTGSCTP